MRRKTLSVCFHNACAALLLVLPVLGYGHGDEDHGEGAAPPLPAAVASGPRLDLTTPDFALFGVVEKDRLIVWLDRYATNEPVLNASIEAESTGRKIELKPTAGGSYEGSAAWLAAPGKHELSFTVQTEDASDLLIGALEVPAPASEEAPGLPLPSTAWIWSGGGVLLIAATALLLRRSRRKGERL